MARGILITPEQRKACIAALRRGLSAEAAAQESGVSKSTAREASFRYCGAPALRDQFGNLHSYCAAHHGVVYGGPTIDEPAPARPMTRMQLRAHGYYPEAAE